MNKNNKEQKLNEASNLLDECKLNLSYLTQNINDSEDNKKISEINSKKWLTFLWIPFFFFKSVLISHNNWSVSFSPFCINKTRIRL